MQTYLTRYDPAASKLFRFPVFVTIPVSKPADLPGEPYTVNVLTLDDVEEDEEPLPSH